MGAVLKSEQTENIHQTKSPGINRKFEQLSGLNFRDDPNPYLWLQKRAKEMSTFEIDRLLEEFPDKKSEDIIPYRMRRAQLWWNGPACLVALIIGLGLGSSRGVSSPAKLGASHYSVPLDFTWSDFFRFVRRAANPFSIYFSESSLYPCNSWNNSLLKITKNRLKFYPSTSRSCMLSTTFPSANTLVTITI